MNLGFGSKGSATPQTSQAVTSSQNTRTVRRLKTPRHTLQMRMIVRAAIICTALLGCAALLAGQIVSTAIGNRAWYGEDFVESESWYDRAMGLNFVERWKAPYNRGLAKYGQRSWQSASADFELAASLAPADEQCKVRLNWSWALEGLGDEYRRADDETTAATYYKIAQTVLQDAECSDINDDPEDEPDSRGDDSDDTSDNSPEPKDDGDDKSDSDPGDEEQPDDSDGQSGQDGQSEPDDQDGESDVPNNSHVDQPGGSEKQQQTETLQRLETKRTGQPTDSTQGDDTSQDLEELERRQNEGQRQLQEDRNTETEVPKDSAAQDKDRNW